MQIKVNGADMEAQDGATIQDLLAQSGSTSGFVAVECNGQIVPRKEHDRHILAPGDRLEIVHAVGGG